MKQTVQSRAVLLTLLLVGAAVGGTVSLAAATASVSPSPAQITSQDSQESFSAEVETYDGQVAVEDGVVTVTGSSSTDADVVVVFVGSRGTVVASALSVIGDRFGATVSLDGMEEGFVDGVVLSSGSDEMFGTPGDGPESSDDLVDYATDLGDRDLTQDQVREVLLEATVNGGGSDDRVVDTPFVLTEGNVRLTDVVPASDRQASAVQPIPVGETMVVRGVTNRRPDDLLIDVTVSAPDGDAVDVTTLDDWETDGRWEVELTVPSDALPGTYTVEADDGERSDRVDVAVVAASTSSTATATPDPDPTTTTDATSTATAMPTQTTTAGPEPTPESTSSPTPVSTTDTESPGFGVETALGSLILVTTCLWLALRHRS
jgi:major cell surface glycoprotein (TIGR04216 family)